MDKCSAVKIKPDSPTMVKLPVSHRPLVGLGLHCGVL